MNSVRDLLQAIFEADPAAPPASKASAGRRARQKLPGDGRAEQEPKYTAKRFEGEYDVWFRRKPLGVGLVPSTQLYGSWEVSSVLSPDGDDAPASPSKNQKDRSAIAHGDVLIAVNFSCRKAQLPRANLAAYLRNSKCPIVMTLRKPDVYGSFDSRALSTAMYPASVEYKGQSQVTKVVARAPSKQWRRSLQHDLALNAHAAKQDERRKLAQALVQRDARKAQQPITAAGVLAALEKRESTSSCSSVVTAVSPAKSIGGGDVGPSLSPLGEFEVTFDETPLHLVLAPSTRMYGSVEVYDPKQNAPMVQVGDVIMAVNGDSTVARLASDDLIDFIIELQAPVTLCFRRPVVYRNYLATFFHEDRTVSSHSVANSMFPPSAEYKKLEGKARARPTSRKGSGVSLFNTEISTVSTPERASAPIAEDNNEETDPLRELKEFAAKIGAMDQFKMWGSSGRTEAGKAPGIGQSAILTERHVNFLRNHLPNYLSCNEMELVYTTRHHGWNQLSFFSMLENKGPTVLVVQDVHDNLFGAFCPASWKRTPTIYGNGRTFVFSLSPRMEAYMWSGLDSSYMYAHHEAIFVGGGRKGIALCLQLDERRGFTKACSTFDSPPLSECEDFRCQTIEVWGFSGLKV
ncbi:hypothetical protein BBJ28_00021934 [Nothophytophthora sp. Chile5]|nr:hypothetical protein BBJ28_00021934 [Nothophytophthora sp. Chile5]